MWQFAYVLSVNDGKIQWSWYSVTEYMLTFDDGTLTTRIFFLFLHIINDVFINACHDNNGDCTTIEGHHWKFAIKRKVQAMEMLCCGKLLLSKQYQMIFYCPSEVFAPRLLDNCDPTALYLEFHALVMYQNVSMVDIKLQRKPILWVCLICGKFPSVQKPNHPKRKLYIEPFF